MIAVPVVDLWLHMAAHCFDCSEGQQVVGMTRVGSFTSPGCATGFRGMSAMPPIAPELTRWDELTRSARKRLMQCSNPRWSVAVGVGCRVEFAPSGMHGAC